MRAHFATVLLLATALLTGAGCRRGPADDSVRADLQQRLDDEYAAGLFEVGELSRKGAYPFHADADERDRLLVYYDAELTFREGRRLTDWDTVGVGSLVGVLGATPMGVRGVDPDGNEAGDTLEIYGAVTYARDAGGWERVADAPADLPAAAGVTEPVDVHEELDLTPRQRQLRRLEQVGAALDRRGDAGATAVFDTALERFTARGECRLAAAEGRPSLATGLPFGAYAELGDALADVLDRDGAALCLLPTAGSAENCQRVAAGDVTFALAQADVAAMARDGSGLFAGEVPMRELRALAALYPEAVQVVTLADRGIASLDDLRGRRVDLGPVGSGSRVSALQVLAAAGVDSAAMAHVGSRATGDALGALAAGEIDAVFLTSAWPLAALTELSQAADVRLVPLAPATVGALAGPDPARVAVTLPAHTYPGQDAPCPTVASTSLLIARADAADAQVAALLDALFGQVAELGESAPHAWYVSRETATTGASIPLHPAAERYLAAR